MSSDAEQQKDHIKALEAELNHYVQVCQSQKELLKRYIQLQKKTLKRLHLIKESTTSHLDIDESSEEPDDNEERVNNA